MPARLEIYRGIIMEIFYWEDGTCYASCNDPFEEGLVQSRTFKTPSEAFDNLKQVLDRLYYSLK